MLIYSDLRIMCCNISMQEAGEKGIMEVYEK